LEANIVHFHTNQKEEPLNFGAIFMNLAIAMSNNGRKKPKYTTERQYLELFKMA